MARYIDADLEVSKYVTVWDCDCSEFGKQTVMAVDDLHYLPTADVAPRAEVAREIFEEIKKIGVVTQVIRSGKIIYDVTAEYAALQKKYTEAETEPPKGD